MKQKDTLKTLLYREFPFFLSAPAIVWQMLFLYVPLFLVLVSSFLKKDAIAGTAFTFEHYGSLWNKMHAVVIARSCFLALCNVTLCLLLAYPVAYFLARYSRRWKNFFLFFLTLPFWVSLLVQTHAWFNVLDNYGLINQLLLKLHLIQKPLQLINSQFAVHIVMTYCYLPFMILPIYSIVEKIDHRLEEASMDLGATWLQTFWKISLPLSLPGIQTGVLFVLIPSFGEFVIPALVGGGKEMYVGSLIFHYFLVARESATGAAFTCLSALVLLLLVLIVYAIMNALFGPSTKRGVA